MGRSSGRTFAGVVRAVALVSALALVVSSCSALGGSTGSPLPSQGRPLRAVPDVEVAGFAAPPPGSGFARYTDQSLSWQGCKVDLQCATALVPLDYSQPDGRAITLALAKRPATASKRLGTLFVNPGGPGGSGVEFVGSFRRQGLEGYDLVGWDPRGVGSSTPVSCPGADLDRLLSMDISPDDAREQSALVEADRELGQDCLKKSGPQLEHVSTMEVARDLDLLRGLVGDDKLNLYGASYGTQIGATYAQLFGSRVGRMVLDGAVNITGDTSVSQAQGFDRALGAFATWCAAQRCALGATKGEVLQSVTGLWSRLDGDPLRVGTRQLTQQLAVAGVVRVLYANSDAYRFLLQALQTAIADRNGRLLLLLADQLNDRNPQGGYGQINYAFPAVRCLDRQDRGVQGEIDLAEQAAAKAPTVGPFFGPDLQCPMWPVAAVPKVKLVGAGAPPVVVIGTTGDPATPYEYAVSMARQLRSGVLLTFKGQGHTAYGQSGCVQQRVVAYLVDGAVPRDGSTC
jgi:pimeloyl-ACP methyl ester carboxylesterase